MSLPKNFVAFGGGHGLAATLKALRLITDTPTAIVGVSDNGGSSGRLREDFSIVPPGDLRMALTALCADDDWGNNWAEVLQHRFPGDGALAGHAVGNLLITALWQTQNDIVAGLDAVSALLGVKGRVLPLALEPLDISARVMMPNGEINTVTGQVEVATTAGKVLDFELTPPECAVSAEALVAIKNADVLIFGPGSWFTSVLTHLAVGPIYEAILKSSAQKIVIVNLTSQMGETEGFSPAEHLRVLADFAPEFKPDCVIAEITTADSELQQLTNHLGWNLLSVDLVDVGDFHLHDAGKLAKALLNYLESAPVREGAR